MKIKRGSTFRVPLTILDEQGVPVSFNDGTVTITPDPADPVVPDIVLTHGNGKFLHSSFTWRGKWSASSPYVIGDAVLYGDDYWIAVANNTGQSPPGNVNWTILAQFTILLSAVETASFTDWSRGSYDIDVEFGNGDVKLDYISDRVQVEDA